MDCFTNKRDTPEKQMDFLIGQSGGFPPVDHKLFYLAILCLHEQPMSKQSSVKVSFNNKDVEHKHIVESDDDLCSSNEPLLADSESSDTVKRHICDIVPGAIDNCNSCGCELFIPKKKLPPILFQQTYNKWKASLDLNCRFRQMRKKKVIYIQPLEHFPAFVNDFRYTLKQERRTGFLNFLTDFLGIFFSGFDVRLLNTKLITEYGWKVKKRYHHKTKKEQLLVKDIYSNMKRVIPKDGFCMLGITWTDLYPSDDLNFVLGEASSVNRSAAFCFGRYEPKAYKGDIPPPPIEEITGDLIWRMIKVISHETCHLFTVSHCVFFHCAMNESTSLEEALSQPLFMCPVCLRKIHKVRQFDILQRYKDLLEFLSEIQGQYPSEYASNAIVWLEKCVYYLSGEKPETPISDSISTHL